MFKLLISYGLLVYSVTVTASTQSNEVRAAVKTPTYADVLNWSVSLLLVLGIFFLCVWLIRKSGQLSLTGKSQLSVVAGLSVGMREKVVLIRVGNKQLLLGVTPGRIDKLMELEGEDKLFQETTDHERGEFAGKLLQVLKGRTDA